ncbi:MAG: acyltransferase family protein [Lentisphaeria bacterium]|nr:acyltransferase family protein [Lentisphaeria bacterium]
MEKENSIMDPIVSEKKKTHDYSLDLIKILAFVGVLYNHRAPYSMAMDANAGIVIQTLATLCRCAVPLFFLCSGITLLKKNESIGQLFLHRVLRIVIVMLLCTVVRGWGQWTAAALWNVFWTKLNWYLYAYFDYLLMLPFLRCIAQKTAPAEADFFIAAAALFQIAGGILIAIGQYTGLIDFVPIFNTQFASLAWGIVFPLAGYFLYHLRLGDRKIFIVLLSAGAVVSIGLSVYFVMRDIRLFKGAHNEALRTHFVFLPSLLLFWLIGKFYESAAFFKNEKVRQYLGIFAGTVFGAFLLETHAPLIWFINSRLSPLTPLFGVYLTGIIALVYSYMVYFFAVMALKQLPGLNKLL